MQRQKATGVTRLRLVNMLADCQIVMGAHCVRLQLAQEMADEFLYRISGQDECGMLLLMARFHTD